MGQSEAKLDKKTVEELCRLTDRRFTEQEIQDLHKDFLRDCPTGKVTLAGFKRVYGRYFPTGTADEFSEHVFRTFDMNGDGVVDFREFLLAASATSKGTPNIAEGYFPTGTADEFSEHVFRTFDMNGDGVVDFREFLLAASATSKGTVEDKLRWAFSMYDMDGDGCITRAEMVEILQSIHKMMTPQMRTALLPDNSSPQERTDELFQLMDANKDDKININEFIRGAQQDKELIAMLTQNALP